MASAHTSCFSATRCSASKCYLKVNINEMPLCISVHAHTCNGVPGHHVSDKSDNRHVLEERVCLTLNELLPQSIAARRSVMLEEIGDSLDSAHFVWANTIVVYKMN